MSISLGQTTFDKLKGARPLYCVGENHEYYPASVCTNKLGPYSNLAGAQPLLETCNSGPCDVLRGDAARFYNKHDNEYQNVTTDTHYALEMEVVYTYDSATY